MSTLQPFFQIVSLNKFNYKDNDTLVVLSLNDPALLDVLCPTDSPDSAKDQSYWNSDIIPYSYLRLDSQAHERIRSIMGVEQIEKLTTNSIEGLFNLLTQRNIDFRFMILDEYPFTILNTVVNKFDKNIVKLNPGINMYDFCQSIENGFTDTNQPSIIAHSQLADAIYRSL